MSEQLEALKKQDTREFWNANPCGTSTSWERAQNLRFEYTDPFLPPLFDEELFGGRQVLEIGCGQGLDAERISQHCASYVGVDMSSESVEIARREVDRRKPPGVSTHFEVADAENLRFEDATFDVVYSYGVLHHTPGFESALSEAMRVLKPGGDLVVMLYRSYTPLWGVLRTCRGAFGLLSEKRRERFLAQQRENAQESEYTGTAMLELFGCPVIDTYTLRGMRRRLRGKAEITRSEFHRVGIDQVIRVLPGPLQKIWPHSWTTGIERVGRRWCGFYMLIRARKHAPESSASTGP